MNNDGMLATAHRGNIVVNDLYKTNFMIVSLVKTLTGCARLLSFTKIKCH
ncbi:hypothetical protein J2X05_000838 [Cellvibrio fibrivorans]|uniref:Beta-lactamase n=1 Tax=Cellvibrio fibrivorans TaxID=126350 RepID=A0ABU1UUK2_9GAMM|nr:hypothetical protein [Cellvibrio fibrivorans]